jgi:predicted patatin/cPLA2 family phospholipase
MTIGSFKPRVISTTTDLSTAEMVVIDSKGQPNFKAAKLALLTSAIPIIFEEEEFEHNGNIDLGIDGGVGRNNPIELAIKAGATKIILVGTSPNTLPRKIIGRDIISKAARLETAMMHIFEERCWEEVEDYQEFHRLAPDKYQSIEICDWYPKEADMMIENEVNALDFTAIQTAQKGYDAAVEFITPARMRDFLLK